MVFALTLNGILTGYDMLSTDKYIKLWIRRLIAIVFWCAQVIIPKTVVSICVYDYNMPNSQYDDANVLSQMILKTPAAAS
jgi:hypothetical protein